MTDALVEGRAAHARRDWGRARALLSAHRDAPGAGGADLLALSDAEWWLGHIEAALDAAAAAYRRHQDAGDVLLEPEADQTVLVYSAAPGTPEASALELLRVTGLERFAH
ncbi:hypothetical protein ALI22I_30465 [Saccharothrix sp. ALI-22-I]|uniref:hypothetical protein n=1 Tax=Saccharothrix sp. ALI-22-I TaxID=1933778 RepID=UPI00097CA903|nr:hypothetical protein [Saccharothrix sp. ALI-22-I]ONI84813.1 hypothetical protein ALI22I_30465 [Saccharothrix sp. ALI-22-I]